MTFTLGLGTQKICLNTRLWALEIALLSQFLLQFCLCFTLRKKPTYLHFAFQQVSATITHLYLQ